MDQNTLMTVALIALVGVMLYFSTRSRKKQMAAHKERLDAIKPGVRVTTIAGLQGTVTAVADDTMELEIAPGVRTTWLRTAVRDIVVDAPVTVDELEPYDETQTVDESPSVDSLYPTDSLETSRGSRDDSSKKDLN